MNKSLQLIIAFYYLSMVLSMTTKHIFNFFFVKSPDWKMLQNFVCHTRPSNNYGIAVVNLVMEGSFSCRPCHAMSYIVSVNIIEAPAVNYHLPLCYLTIMCTKSYFLALVSYSQYLFSGILVLI